MLKGNTSCIGNDEWAYPHSKPNAAGRLKLSDIHTMYWEEHGNVSGEPVMALHGGPGGGMGDVFPRYFDPARYRIIQFDQRGCGQSTPSAADDDPMPALTDNTTPHLIGDINALRNHLGIDGKMHVFGGSWGSTLALAYAIDHPENVESLNLRGIFLCRRKDLDYFYQGNAATYAAEPQDVSIPGTYQFYPDVWKDFVEAIPAYKRGDMVAAYDKIFSSSPQTDDERARLTKAATAWSVWEGATSYLHLNPEDLKRSADPVFARAFARIENHYFMNGAFFGGKSNRDNNYILENAHRIAHIPTGIVQGRYDVVCPMFQAEDLVAALKAAGAKDVDYRLTTAGHSMRDRETALALTDMMDNRAPMAARAVNNVPRAAAPAPK